jgi:GT2 family glycosyltransferase
VAVPTLAADDTLAECLRSLDRQTFRDFDAIVVDNSGEGRAARVDGVRERATIIENERNVGFGAAVNQAIRASRAPFIATLNDDAIAHPRFLEAMLAAMEARYEIGMCAPQIRLYGEDRLDSAGMLLCRDGSSKQRGHLEPASNYQRVQQVLLPSGCAALYRRDMLDEIGLFDESFFLYCEDTDLGLRARWKLWECVYVPDAVVEHRYSRSAGNASSLKAWYVERNRHLLLVKNFPMRDLAVAPLYALARYFWHTVYLLGGKGKTAEFRGAGENPLKLVGYVLRAQFEVARHWPRMWRERRRIQKHGRMNAKQFHRMVATYSISPRRVAGL